MQVFSDYHTDRVVQVFSDYHNDPVVQIFSDYHTDRVVQVFSYYHTDRVVQVFFYYHTNRVVQVLRCCNSRLKSTRKEACILIYSLMKANFEFTKKKSFTRVHLQVRLSLWVAIRTLLIQINTYKPLR